MNVSALFQSFVSLNSAVLIPEPPQEVLDLLGYSVIVLSNALEKFPKISKPFVLVGNEVFITRRITGAVIVGTGGFILDQIAFLHSQPGWYDRARIMIVGEKPNRSVMRALWQKKIMNAFYYQGELVYAYNPFNDTILEVATKDLKRVLNERWDDLYGYKIPIVMYDQNLSFKKELGATLGAGIDGSAIYELAKYWNMTPQLTYISPTGDAIHDANLMLFLDQADLAMNSRFVSHGRGGADAVEYSSPIYDDAVVILVKKPSKLSGLKIFTMIFKWQLWLSIFGTVTFMTKAMVVMSSKSRTHWSSLTLVLRSIANVPINKLPKTTLERWIISLGFLMGLIIITLFQGTLYYFIKERVTSNKLRTVNEVYKNYQLVCNSPLIRELIYSDPSEYFKQRHVAVRTIENSLFDNYAFVVFERELELGQKTGDIRGDLYLVEESLLSFSMSYVLKKGSPYYDKLCHFTTHSLQGGLADRWHQMTVERTPTVSRTVEDNSKHVLTASDIEVAFFVLRYGLCLSTLIFLLELLLKCQQEKRFLCIWLSKCEEILESIYP